MVLNLDLMASQTADALGDVRFANSVHGRQS